MAVATVKSESENAKSCQKHEKPATYPCLTHCSADPGQYNRKKVQTLRDEMLLVLLNTFSTQYNEFDFSAIYRADSAGSRILSFTSNNYPNFEKETGIPNLCGLCVIGSIFQCSFNFLSYVFVLQCISCIIFIICEHLQTIC